jgi:hypothetical protein
MAATPTERGFACTLDAPAIRLREEEFRQLFARSLQSAEVLDACSARLLLDASCEGELRALLAREQRCCSFFGFEVSSADGAVAVAVHVPEGSEAALAFLLGLTGSLG